MRVRMVISPFTQEIPMTTHYVGNLNEAQERARGGLAHGRR